MKSAPRAGSSAASRLSRQSRAIGQSSGSAPIPASIAARPKLFEVTIWSGPGVSPGFTSSSPVAISATTGRRATVTSGTFIAASRATSRGRQPARRLEPVALREVAAGGADVVAGGGCLCHGDAVALAARVLLDQDGVGALRHRRAGEDADGGARRQRAGMAPPRGRLADDRQDRADAPPRPPAPHSRPSPRRRRAAGCAGRWHRPPARGRRQGPAAPSRCRPAAPARTAAPALRRPRSCRAKPFHPSHSAV